MSAPISKWFAATMLAVCIWQFSFGARGGELEDVLEQCETLTNANKFLEAEAPVKRLMTLAERSNDALRLGWSQSVLGRIYIIQARYADAEVMLKRAIGTFEKSGGKDNPRLSVVFVRLGSVYESQDKFAEAEAQYLRAVSIDEKAYGRNHHEVSMDLLQLVQLYEKHGLFAKAEPLLQRALSIEEQAVPPNHQSLAMALSLLADLYKNQGRYAEAEPLFKRAIASVEKALGPDDADVAVYLQDLAFMWLDQGRTAEAEPLSRRALEIAEKYHGPEHPSVASHLSSLAVFYLRQSRHGEAEPLAKRAIAIFEKAAPDSVHIAHSLRTLGCIYLQQKKYDEAAPLWNRSIELYTKVFGPDYREIAVPLSDLALSNQSQKNFDEAERYFKQALAIREKAFGPNHPLVAITLSDLAGVYDDQRRDAEGELLVERALTILEPLRANLDSQQFCYFLQAIFGWRAGRRDEAIADLHRAMDLAEQLRGQSSGGEQERAKYFNTFSRLFELMLEWQTELGNAGEALAALERGRARSLLDEMNSAGRDLQAGRSSTERETLRQREGQLRSQVASLEKQLELAKTDDERKALQRQLAEARDALYHHHRDQRTSSPVYRNLLSVGAGPLRLSQLQRSLGRDGDLMLAYWLGEEKSYVLAIAGDNAKLHQLNLDAVTANELGLKAGPLATKDFNQILIGDGRTGILRGLSNREAKPPVAKLHALWKLLVPAALRDGITGGKFKRLVVVPDGDLALLPFETLIVESADEPVYLLDRGPSVFYGPSATVLYNLLQRLPSAGKPVDQPVLTVGDVVYGSRSTTHPSDSLLASLAPRSRYGSVGGKLAPLPFTGWESNWVVEGFGKSGIDVGKLQKEDATEAKVRAAVAGKNVVHFACHGLVDQEHGNFFGALALTPGAKGNTDSGDDGFLTLAEIYDLNLKGCELAILSACETNYGPQQRGEGVWALSRGFLVAGSRRVMASNWLVDDQAAASLVSVVCQQIARDQKAGQTDYADALHKAKLWTRKQDKWKHPYYWGTFVLVGPN